MFLDLKENGKVDIKEHRESSEFDEESNNNAIMKLDYTALTKISEELKVEIETIL